MSTPAATQSPRRADAGMTTVQVTILFPVVLLWLMLIVQFGLWWHAKQVANGAAAEAVTVARAPTGTEPAGEQAAVDYLDAAGNLTQITVDVDRGTNVVTAIVTGHAPRLVPGFAWSITSVSEAPIERFIPAGER